MTAIVGSSNSGFAVSASTTVSVPSGAAAGDTLFMAIMCRNDLTEGLSGWEEVISAGPTVTASQKTRLYKREHNGTDTDFTVTQAASGRMALCIVAVRGSVTTIDAIANVTTGNGNFPVPVYTAPQSGTLLLASSWVITYSSTEVTVTSPANWDLWSIQSTLYNRLAVATYDIAADESVDGELFSQSCTDSSEYATVTVFINPPVFEDTRLNLQAATWTTDDIKTYFRAHDGLEFENIALALQTGAFSLNDLKIMSAAFHQSRDDVTLFLKILARYRSDLPLFLQAHGRELSDISLPLSTAGNHRSDLPMLLKTVSPTVLNDIAIFLSATDGAALNDIRLRLSAIRQAPQYRSNIAQRLSSVISEVA